VIPSDNEPITDAVEAWLYFFRRAASLTREELLQRLPDPIFAEAVGVPEMIGPPKNVKSTTIASRPNVTNGHARSKQGSKESGRESGRESSRESSKESSRESRRESSKGNESNEFA